MSDYDGFADRWHERMQKRPGFAHTFIEKPALFEALGNVQDLDVLALGCGTGEECEMLKKKGARYAKGIDLARELIARATATYPGIVFAVEDLRTFTVEKERYDIIIASLSLHYAKSWGEILERAWQSLRGGGRFVITTHHPAKWGGETTRGTAFKNILGYEKENGDYKVYGDYLHERKIEDVWFDGLDVSFYHRPLQEMFKDILDSKLKLKSFKELAPIESGQKEDRVLYDIYSKIPLFVLFELEK